MPGILAQVCHISNTLSRNDMNLLSNFLCLVTNVVLILWLLFSTKFSKSSLPCWLRFSSISSVQQVYPWGQKRRCSPAGGRIDGISSTAGGLAYLTAESSLSSKRCDWATFITEPIKDKLGWNKWERIIFVSNPPSRGTWRGFDTPEHVAPSGCLFIAAQKTFLFNLQLRSCISFKHAGK